MRGAAMTVRAGRDGRGGEARSAPSRGWSWWSPSVEDYAREIAAVGELAAKLGIPFDGGARLARLRHEVHAAGQRLAARPPLDGVYAATRARLPAAILGGGMFTYFTELNRKRPPARPSRPRHLHHLGARPCRRRPHRDGDAGGLARRSPGARRRSPAESPSMSGRARIGMREQSLRRRADGEPAATSARR